MHACLVGLGEEGSRKGIAVAQLQCWACDDAFCGWGFSVCGAASVPDAWHATTPAAPRRRPLPTARSPSKSARTPAATGPVAHTRFGVRGRRGVGVLHGGGVPAAQGARPRPPSRQRGRPPVSFALGWAHAWLPRSHRGRAAGRGLVHGAADASTQHGPVKLQSCVASGDVCEVWFCLACARASTRPPARGPRGRGFKRRWVRGPGNGCVI